MMVILFGMTKLVGVVRFAAAADFAACDDGSAVLCLGLGWAQDDQSAGGCDLPADVPAFLRNGEALDTMEYLGPEPDRWRNRAEDELL